MQTSLKDSRLTIQILPNTLHLLRFKSSGVVPDHLLKPQTRKYPFHNVTYTDSEISVMTSNSMVEPAQKDAPAIEGPFGFFRLKGPLDLSMVGILVAIAEVLKQADVPIMAMSTHDTDYVAIKSEHFEAGLAALAQAGWKLERLWD